MGRLHACALERLEKKKREEFDHKFESSAMCFAIDRRIHDGVVVNVRALGLGSDGCGGSADGRWDR
jgi:hypothetical protein